MAGSNVVELSYGGVSLVGALRGTPGQRPGTKANTAPKMTNSRGVLGGLESHDRKLTREDSHDNHNFFMFQECLAES